MSTGHPWQYLYPRYIPGPPQGDDMDPKFRPTPPYTKIGPGIYLDANGNGVMVASEILTHLGIPDTPENRQLVIDLTVPLWKSQTPNVEIHVRPPDDPTWRPHEEA